MGPRVQPRGAPPQSLDAQVPEAQVRTVEIGDLEFSPVRGLDAARQLRGALVVEVDPRHRIIGRRLGGLFQKIDHVAGGVELHHSIALRVVHVIPEHRRSVAAKRRALQQLREVGSVENVVAEYQCRRRAVQEPLGDEQSLRDAVRLRLHGILESDTPLLATAQQLRERDLIPRRGDDQVLPDARRHQRRQRIVNHRLVVYRQQLLALRQGDRMQPRTGASGQYDSLAFVHQPVSLLPQTA